MLGPPGTDLYDWGDDDSGEGVALVDAARPGYRQVADVLRERILSGEYPPGDAIPGQGALAREFEADIAVVNRAVGELAREGLVELAGRGRKTLVLAQRPWHASVTVHRADGGMIPRADRDVALAALAAAGSADPAVSDLEANTLLVPADRAGPPPAHMLVAKMTVLAPDPALAVGRAWVLVRDALRADGEWDLDRASVTARPT